MELDEDGQVIRALHALEEFYLQEEEEVASEQVSSPESDSSQRKSKRAKNHDSDVEMDDGSPSSPTNNNKKKEEEKKKKKITNEELVEIPNKILLISDKYGMMPEYLHKTALLIANENIDLRIRSRLVSAMIPRATIEDNTVIELLGPFSTYSVDLQQKVLRWILMTCNIINRQTLRKLYGVFFTLLRIEALCQDACQLLVQITEKSDVTPYRVRHLQSIYANKFKLQRHVLSLLAIYKEFSPSTVVLPKEAHDIVTRIPNVKWYEKMKAVQRRFNNNGSHDESMAEEDVVPAKSNTFHKRLKAQSSIPAPFLFQMTNKDVKWLESQIGNEFAIPQMAALLHPESRTLRHYVSLHPAHASRRINTWLQVVLDEDFLCPKDEARQGKLLSGITDLAHFYEENVVVLEHFLVQFLITWDGYTQQEYILKLISLISPCSYQYLFVKFLQPISKLFFMVDAVTKGRIFASLTGLLKHWLSLDWGAAVDPQRDFGIFAPRPKPDSVDYYRTIFDFIIYLDHLGSLALAAESQHPIIQHHVLALWEEISHMHRTFGFPFSLPPSADTVFRFLLSSNPMAVDRVCGMIAQYAREFEVLKKDNKNESLVYPMALTFNNDGDTISSQIKNLNSYIWDFCLTLWRCKAFAYPEGESSQSKSKFNNYLGLDDEVIEALHSFEDKLPDMQASFSIAHSFAFASLAYKYLHLNLENEADVVLHPNLLNGEAKIVFLDFMKDKGWFGLYDFLYTSMNSLKMRQKATPM